MYKQYLKTLTTEKGLGVISSVEIPTNIPIFEFKGNLFTRQSLKHDMSQVLQIGPDTYLGPSGDIDDYVNHSCNPNCCVHTVGNRAILYSLYVIPIELELTFDYSTTSTDTLDFWKMNCLCGNFNCRKIISGFQLLDTNTQEDYIKKGLVPQYVINK